MIPKPYSTSVSLVQAGVATVALVCMTIALALDKVSGDAFVAILGGVVGAVLGTVGTVAGANGVAHSIQRAADAAVQQRPPAPPE